jgi:hypothetical protein
MEGAKCGLEELARERQAGAVPRLRGSVGWLAIVVVRAGSKGTRHGAREDGSQ